MMIELLSQQPVVIRKVFVIFGLVLLNVLSLFLLAAIVGLSLVKRRTPGAVPFGVLIFFAFFWSLGTFIELSVPSFEAKLLWRNLTQIGTFYLPVATIVFVFVHIGIPVRKSRLVGVILGCWQLIPFFLIWSDEIHHLMRVSVALGSNASGFPILIVKQTVLGMVYVSINYAMMAAGVLILLFTAFRRPAARASLIIVAVGMALPSIFSSLINTFGTKAFGGIPAATSFALGAVLILIGIRYFGFLMLTPIARDRAFDVIDEGILVCDADGNIVDMNHAARTMLARNYALPHAAPAADFGRCLSKALNASIPELCAAKERRFSLKLISGDAQVYYVLRSYELKNDKAIIGYTSVLQDVSDDTHRMNRLMARAERDSLTGIYNKQAFNDIVSDRLEQIPAGTGFLMMFDIDHFKTFNDRYGHLFGDAVIKEVCRRCKETLREGDIFGRVGGDEFALFFSGLEAEAAYNLADRIRKAISSKKIDLGDNSAAISISCGIAGSADTGGRDQATYSLGELFERADAALYKSKAAGRDRVCLFSEKNDPVPIPLVVKS